MTTKSELVAFIRAVACNEHSPSDWEAIAVAHYGDEDMETARREMARHYLGYGTDSGNDTPLRKRLEQIARQLEGS